ETNLGCECCLPHNESQAPKSSSGDAPEPSQDNASAAQEPRNTVIRRAGTLDELERGLHLRWRGFARRSSSTSPSSKQKRDPAYTLRQAFLIVAGGLAVETKAFHQESYLTVTPDGAIELAMLGLLKPISETVIDDKSKADPITKTIACVQAGWFIVQCISRVAQHLPLTLLEVHVLTHVLMAFLMYLFWFAKPYGVLSPVVINDSSVIEAAALFTSFPTRDGAYRPTCVLQDTITATAIRNAIFKTDSKGWSSSAVSINKSLGFQAEGSRSED
ncbi:MAG: hypothetical protein Q9201_007955, partial [Fulgogasparrea decipioides]